MRSGRSGVSRACSTWTSRTGLTAGRFQKERTRSLSTTHSDSACMVDFSAPSKQGWFLWIPQRVMQVPHTFTATPLPIRSFSSFARSWSWTSGGRLKMSRIFMAGSFRSGSTDGGHGEVVGADVLDLHGASHVESRLVQPGTVLFG